MTAVDLLFDLPQVLVKFCEKLLEVLTTEITIGTYSISLWAILASASVAILLGIIAYSIIKG